MSLYNAIVWIDHDEAYVFRFNSEESEEIVIHSKHRRSHMLHPTRESHRYTENMTSYFKSIDEALVGANELLISGPSSAKFEYEKHLVKHAKLISVRIIGIEKADHPNTEVILNMARKYFRAPKEMVASSYVAGV